MLLPKKYLYYITRDDCFQGSVSIGVTIDPNSSTQGTYAMTQYVIRLGFIGTELSQAFLFYFYLTSDGSRVCLGDNCPETTSGDDESHFNETLVYSIIGIGVAVIILTVIAVVFCIVNRKEDPDLSKMPFQEEDGFGFATHWQAGYVTTMKPDMNGGGF